MLKFKRFEIAVALGSVAVALVVLASSVHGTETSSEKVPCSQVDTAVAAAFQNGEDDLAYELSLRQLECPDEGLKRLKGALDHLEDGLGRLTRAVIPGVDI